MKKTKKQKKPNVLYIISDQHNAKCLGCAEHPVVKTPNLDKLASEGVRFTSAITQNTICTPSRISCISGQYAHNHGFYANAGAGVPKPEEFPSTILRHFREHGYRTASLGKCHCPDSWVENDCDIYRGVSLNADYSKDDPGLLSDYDRYLQKKSLLHLKDHEVYPEQKNLESSSKDARCSKLRYKDSVEGWTAQEADKFIAKNGNEPWIMLLGFERPHQLYSPSKEFWDMYLDDIPMPPHADVDLSLKAPHLRKTRQALESGAEEYLFGEKTYEALRQRKLRGYYGLISQTDHAIGEVLNSLRRNGQYENTIVIYTSDHGEYACGFGLLEKAPGICSDDVTRVPNIWRYPGVFNENHISDRIVEAVDFPTTVTSLAGLPPFVSGDGRDISPLLKGKDVQIHHIGVTENTWSKSVRKGPWRLVHYPQGMFSSETFDRRIGELYNLDNDPWEINNLFYEPVYRDIVGELQLELLDWLIQTDRPINVHPYSPEYDHEGKVMPEYITQLIKKSHVNYL